MDKRKNGQKIACTGTKSISEAVKSIEPDIIVAYPITPQTEIVENLSQYVEEGGLGSEFISVESEHSAMATCIGAGATGSRTFTATASHGLLYMSECVHWAVGARIPLVMAIGNRAIGPPWNLWTEHTDMMVHRDLGWLQFYSGSNQEAYDLTIMAYKIAEDKRVLLPAMVGFDGFTLANTVEPVRLENGSRIKSFLPEYHSPYPLEGSFTIGGVARPDEYWKFREDIKESIESARNVIKETMSKFSAKFGREYKPVMTYKCDDAEDAIILGIGTLAKEAKIAVDSMRDDGLKVGVARLIQYRPFPLTEIKEICKGVEKLIVFDRCYSFGFGGILANEIKKGIDKPINSVIAGLGGQNINYKDIENIIKNSSREEEIWWGEQNID